MTPRLKDLLDRQRELKAELQRIKKEIFDEDTRIWKVDRLSKNKARQQQIRTVLQLREDGKTFKEIGEMFGKTESYAQLICWKEQKRANGK